MTHVLQNLLGINNDNLFFCSGIKQLEKTAGNSGVDTRLIADIIHKSHNAMRKLGLEVSDTTGKELYYAIESSVWRGEAEDIFEDTDYALVAINNQIISLNLIDIIENAHHQLPYGQQTVAHGQRSLRGEIISRYSCHGRTNEQTTHEIALSMGILPESDAWYNYSKYKHNRNQSAKKAEGKKQ